MRRKTLKEIRRRLSVLECAARGHETIETRTREVKPDLIFEIGAGTLTTKVCLGCKMEISKVFTPDKLEPKHEAVTIVPDHYLASDGDVPGEVSHLADYMGDHVGELIQPGQMVIVLSEEQGLKVLDDLSYVSDELEVVTEKTVKLI